MCRITASGRNWRSHERRTSRRVVREDSVPSRRHATAHAGGSRRHVRIRAPSGLQCRIRIRRSKTASLFTTRPYAVVLALYPSSLQPMSTIARVRPFCRRPRPLRDGSARYSQVASSAALADHTQRAESALRGVTPRERVGGSGAGAPARRLRRHVRGDPPDPPGRADVGGVRHLHLLGLRALSDDGRSIVERGHIGADEQVGAQQHGLPDRPRTSEGRV